VCAWGAHKKEHRGVQERDAHKGAHKGVQERACAQGVRKEGGWG